MSVSLKLPAIVNSLIRVRALLILLGWMALQLEGGSSAFGASTVEPEGVDFELKGGAAYPSAPHYADIEPLPGHHGQRNVAQTPLSLAGDAFTGPKAAGGPGGLLDPAQYAAPTATGARLGDLNGDGNDDVLLRHTQGRCTTIR